MSKMPVVVFCTRLAEEGDLRLVELFLRLLIINDGDSDKVSLQIHFEKMHINVLR